MESVWLICCTQYIFVEYASSSSSCCTTSKIHCEMKSQRHDNDYGRTLIISRSTIRQVQKPTNKYLSTSITLVARINLHSFNHFEVDADRLAHFGEISLATIFQIRFTGNVSRGLTGLYPTSDWNICQLTQIANQFCLLARRTSPFSNECSNVIVAILALHFLW